jgi:hypothetical protein
MGLPPVTSVVSKEYLRCLYYPFGEKAWAVCLLCIHVQLPYSTNICVHICLNMSIYYMSSRIHKTSAYFGLDNREWIFISIFSHYTKGHKPVSYCVNSVAGLWLRSHSGLRPRRRRSPSICNGTFRSISSKLIYTIPPITFQITSSFISRINSFHAL